MVLLLLFIFEFKIKSFIETLGWRSWYQQIDQSTILEEEETKLCENELPILKNGL